ncbi:hypothetical protein [Fictibacillus barbaricus]|uniref:Septal ring factor EnvC (AmiA/AmiB activator) n=1 Tax=Fictibacillus barbaricus TaxID=182136 RepID=A0ABU1U1R2_9BACL|nr:hypothetical protein [Fictibacillus barbaricus]MDR7073425.1 septal ring factor EnvC (AmiA/AmiB activator) [Fictibacillus barbaricus]
MNQRVVDVVLEAAEEDFLVKNKDTETFAAELALLASSLVTVGDFLATISAALVLRQIQIDRIEQLKAEKEQETQMKDIQDQLSDLKKEIKALRGR